jgi:hypothetical protein
VTIAIGKDYLIAIKYPRIYQGNGKRLEWVHGKMASVTAGKCGGKGENGVRQPGRIRTSGVGIDFTTFYRLGIIGILTKMR